MPTSRTSPTPTADHDGFLDMKESAKDLRCGERWLRDGINHHGFPHHRFGKSLQTSRQDRIEIRKMCRVPAQPSKNTVARRLRRTADKKTRTTASAATT